MWNEKGGSSYPSIPGTIATIYLPASLRLQEYYMAPFLMFSVNPVGKLPKPGHHRLRQMENLSKGIMMP